MNDGAGNMWWWLVLGMWIAWTASWLLSRLQPITVERVVKRVVGTTLYNPEQTSRLAALETEVATIPALRQTIADLQAAAPIVIEKIIDRPVDVIIEKIVEREVDNPAQLARIGALEAQLAALRATVDLPVSVMLDDAAAKAAGFTVRGMDDLEVIEGIGPKIAGLFRAASIATFSELAQTPVTDMQAILDKGGSRFRLAQPDTWAAQAALASRNDWAALRKMHDELPGGTRKKTGVQ